MVMVMVPAVQAVVVVASMVWPEPDPAVITSVPVQVQPVPPEVVTSASVMPFRSQPLVEVESLVSGAPSLPPEAGSGIVTLT